MENILNLDAPLYFEEKDGCPINWYHCKLKIYKIYNWLLVVKKDLFIIK